MSVLPLVAFAQADEVPGTSITNINYSAVEINAYRIPNDLFIHLDGKLDEKIWKKVVFINRFTQREPFEGEPATDEVYVGFAYDEQALYVGARIIKHSGDIQYVVSRKDRASNSERLIISLDTYLDKITAYSFGVTASGVRLDYYHPEDRAHKRDYNYDPVWDAKTVIDNEGWTVEMRIPFSELRFNSKEELIFGLNVNHYVPNTNEDSYWIYIPKNAVGWSSRFGLLKNIKGIEPPQRLNFLPYFASNTVYKNTFDTTNPFISKFNSTNSVGADIKMGVGSNLTLDATVNPDFGQIDADPAVVNLSAFEVFQSELRPFFNEGRSLLEGGGSGYFYSRRIGARPSYSPDSDFADISSNTTILSAGKLTGRLNNGLSVGILSALTSRESAQTFNLNSNSYNEVRVEPLTSYNVVRLQKEIDDAGSTGGIILTGVKREFNANNHLDMILPRHAYTGGTDWNLRFDEGNYELSVNSGFSVVEGSKDAILNLQQRSSRYFQRPDADYVSLDSTKTALKGYTFGIKLNKNGGEHWLWGIEYSMESPEFELNDIGRTSEADDIDFGMGLKYQENRPSQWYQSWDFGGNVFNKYNYGGIRNFTYFEFSGNIQWLNYSNNNLRFGYTYGGQSDNLTRGGPQMKSPDRWWIGTAYSTNRSQSHYWSVNAEYNANNYNSYGYSSSISGGGLANARTEYQIGFQYKREIRRLQYISTLESNLTDTFSHRYLFSSIGFTTISLNARINFAFTPNISIDFYAEPFVSSGNFYNYGQLEKPSTKRITRFNSNPRFDVQENINGSVLVIEGGESFELSNNDFNIFSFRSNVVLRYEFKPGSTFFFAWQQNRFKRNTTDTLVKPQNLIETFNISGDQIFAVKIAYWL